ncbi:hypothetical protein ABT187_48785 [Streptomyces sp. NPDC001817]|uniref:hypothetical protein n=1 Tax=Streptomyces sp. NPDC001817 TaxID=3154398 RepID=UPI00332F869B
MNALTVVTRLHTDRTVITVSGEMDLQTCPALAEATAGVNGLNWPHFSGLSWPQGQ